MKVPCILEIGGWTHRVDIWEDDYNHGFFRYAVPPALAAAVVPMPGNISPKVMDYVTIDFFRTAEDYMGLTVFRAER